MLTDVFFCLAGFVLLFFGGEWLVRGAVSIAGRLGLSTLMVSVVVVGFGTSAPELLVSVEAAIRSQPDIALGNVVGSNIANILLILGVAGILSDIDCRASAVRRDGLAVVVASLLLCGAALAGGLGRIEGIAMILALAGYLFYSVRSDRAATATVPEGAAHGKDVAAHDSLPVAAGLTLAGLALLVAGAHFLVEGAVSLARGAGVSEAVIGLTLVAVGTSLPELATAAVSAMKKHADVVIGNVLGSNLFNIMSILGLTAIISPIPVAGRIAQTEVWIMLGVAVLALAFIRSGGRISRAEGAGFVALYAAYMGWLFLTG